MAILLSYLDVLSAKERDPKDSGRFVAAITFIFSCEEKAIELVEELERCPLDFSISVLFTAISFCANGIKFIDKNDCPLAPLLVDLFFCQVESISNQLSAVTDVHLH